MDEPTPEQRTLLQFSLRSLFVAAVVVAVISAAAAPGIRMLQRDQLVRLAIVLGVSMLVAAASVVGTCYFRWHKLQRTGRLRMRLSIRRRAWYHAWSLFTILSGLVLFFGGPIAWVVWAKLPYLTSVGIPLLGTVNY